MEALSKAVADIGGQGNGHMVILFAPEGVIYYGNLVSGQIEWCYDTQKVAYQACQTTGVTQYVDIGRDDKSPYYMSDSGPAKAIPGKTTEEIQNSIKFLFKTDPKINADKDMYRLNRLSGKEDKVDGPDTLLVTRTNWDIRIDEHCSLRYSNLDVSFPSSEESAKCLVIYARTDRRLMEICEKYGFVELPGEGTIARIFSLSKRIGLVNPRDKFVNNKGNISYHDGYLGNDKENKVFVKKIPKIKKFEHIKELCKMFYRCEYVIRQLTIDSDECYEYIAYEKMDETLVSMIPKFTPQIAPQIISILRDVVLAVIELHVAGLAHRNILPEHVLLRTGAEGGFTVKLCGLGRSIARSESDADIFKWYELDAHMLAELILLCMTGSIESRVDINCEFPFTGFGKKKISKYYGTYFKAAGPLVEDIVMKLMRAKSDVQAKSDVNTLMKLYHHPIFWTTYDQILFLKDVYDELHAGNLDSMEYLALSVFGLEWTVDEVWLSEMVKVHEEMKSKGMHGTEEMEGAVEQNKVFNQRKLRDLLKIIRHGVNHPSNTWPNLNKLTLGRYVFEKFPNLLTVSYNHVLGQGTHTEVYKQYCPSFREGF